MSSAMTNAELIARARAVRFDAINGEILGMLADRLEGIAAELELCALLRKDACMSRDLANVRCSRLETQLAAKDSRIKELAALLSEAHAEMKQTLRRGIHGEELYFIMEKIEKIDAQTGGEEVEK